MMSMFIKQIKLDEAKRIVVLVQEQFSEYLSKEESKKMLKDMAQKTLGSDFIKLEVSKSSFRITVVEGSEIDSKEKVESEIVKGIEMAMSFMSQMNSKETEETKE